AFRPGVPALLGENPLGHGDLLLSGRLVGSGSELASAELVPGRLSELETTVVAVSGISVPPARRLAQCEAVPRLVWGRFRDTSVQERGTQSAGCHDRSGRELAGVGRCPVLGHLVVASFPGRRRTGMRGSGRGVADDIARRGGQAELRACNPARSRSVGLLCEPLLEVLLDRGDLSLFARPVLASLDLQSDP